LVKETTFFSFQIFALSSIREPISKSFNDNYPLNRHYNYYATGWTTVESKFISEEGRIFSLLYNVQNSFGGRPYCLMGTKGYFTRGKLARA
jgi:hypothetical protein